MVSVGLAEDGSSAGASSTWSAAVAPEVSFWLFNNDQAEPTSSSASDGAPDEFKPSVGVADATSDDAGACWEGADA